jgi:hypothetical protein
MRAAYKMTKRNTGNYFVHKTHSDRPKASANCQRGVTPGQHEACN